MVRDKDMERIYMEQLRDMESVVYFLSVKKQQWERDIYSLRRPYAKPANPHKPQFDIGEYLITITGGIGLFLGGLVVTVGIWFFVYLFTDILEAYPFLNSLILILPCAVTILYWIGITVLSIKEYKESKTDYQVQLEENENIRKNNERAYAANCSLANQKSEELVTINSDLKNAQGILSELYSINWIPNKYRNIHVVYYLTDMVTSSDINMDEALKYYLLQEANNKLDEIIQKMDEIIANQNELIVRQAVTEAQNNSLISQNKKMISQLADIETNTKLSADYSAIGANYSAATAYFSLATYLKN